jgi:hypothetical protein
MSALPPKADIERQIRPAQSAQLRRFSYARSARFSVWPLPIAFSSTVGCNDEAAADRYHRRISLIAGHFETNAPVSDALERLLSASGRWLATNAAERYEAGQWVLELIEPVVDLL